MMKVLLTGASGFIGRNIANALAAAGHEVMSISRHHGVDFSHMQTAADWLPYLKGIDAIINCVGIIGETGGQRFDVLHSLAPSALFRACEREGVRRVLQISALGADETAFSAYHLSKRVADDFLRSLDMDWFILRPSLIYGRGGKSAALFMRLAALPIVPVIGDGRQTLQPIHISDVVATALRALTSATSRQTIDIVGGEVFTFTEWLQQMRRAQGLAPTRTVHIPLSLAAGASAIGRYINPIFQPENFRMLQSSHSFDVQPLTAFLGRTPKKVDSALFFSDI
jgi:uncharacterized protein YbjT (DUF2867 family)